MSWVEVGGAWLKLKSAGWRWEHGLVISNINITLNLPKKAKVFLTSSFRGREILEINDAKTRLQIEILNTSYTEELKITGNNTLGFLVIEPENLSFKYVTKNKTKKETGLPKNWEQTWKAYWEKRKWSKKVILEQVRLCICWQGNC